MRFKRPATGYVWCDFHGGIHERRQDVYDEGVGPTFGRDGCGPGPNWRLVFVETDDPEEEF